MGGRIRRRNSRGRILGPSLIYFFREDLIILELE